MPEFVACPACGCRVLIAESALGQRIRCIGCDHRFTASSPIEVETQRMEPLPANEPPPPAPSPRRAVPPPLPPGFDDPLPSSRPAAAHDEDAPPLAGAELPCCPGCGHRVRWEALRCGHCGEELETDRDYRRVRRRSTRVRRDCESHRGPLLAGMGNVTLFAGGLTLCAAGVPLLLALPLGVTTWVMATNDLAKMRTGEMEDQGRPQTESARTSAVTGIVLALFFAAGWGLLGLSRYLQ